VLAGKVEAWRLPLDRTTFRNPLTGEELKDSVVRDLGLADAPKRYPLYAVEIPSSPPYGDQPVREGCRPAYARAA
jgi:hypothetical protein